MESSGRAEGRRGLRVHVEVAPADVGDGLPVGDLGEAVRTTLESEGVEEAEVSLTLVDDRRIRELNRTYLDRDRPTDVMAFPLHGPGEPVLGDVYLGLDQARRQALDEGIPLVEELLRLAVHGTLHVLGWDHPEGPAERLESPMFRRQEALVGRLLEDSGGPGA